MGFDGIEVHMSVVTIIFVALLAAFSFGLVVACHHMESDRDTYEAYQSWKEGQDGRSED